MGVVGFIDSQGWPIRFEDMRAGAGDWGEVPRAVLLALANNYRSDDHYGGEEVVSATTIIGPVQMNRLLKRHEFFVDPMKNLWSALGTSVHGMFEADVPAGDVAEVKLVTKIHGQLIGGTFDLLESTGEPNHVRGRDYKITSAYSVQAMLKGELMHGKEKYDYFWQAQLYKRMVTDPTTQMVVEQEDGSRVLEPWPLAGTLEVDSWGLVTIIRNWSQRTHGRWAPTPLVAIPIPVLLANERIDNYLAERVTVWQASGMCEDPDLPPCTDLERWSGRRCAEYCTAEPRCHQVHPGLALRDDQ